MEKVLNLTEEPISLDMSIGEEDSTLEDLIADEKSPSPSDTLLEKDLIGHIRKLLAGLSPERKRFFDSGSGLARMESTARRDREAVWPQPRENSDRSRQKPLNDFAIPADTNRSRSILNRNASLI